MAADKVALIVGGSECADEAIAQELIRREWKIVLQGPDAEELNAAAVRASEFSSAPDQVATFLADRTDPAQREQLVEFMLEEFGRIDLLVSAPLGPTVNESLLEMNEQAYAQVMDAYVTSTVFLTQLAANEMVRMTEAETIERLAAEGFGGDELRTLLEDWTLARELREETELDRSERDLSRTDVLGAFRDDIIERIDAEGFLRALGYDDAETQVLLEREELRKGSEARGRTESAARVLFLAGRANRDVTSSTLGNAGITAARVTLLMLQWEAELDARTPGLTTAQVQKAFKAKFIPREDAASRLDAKGYTEEDREILLSLAGSPEGVTEEGV